MLEKTDMDIPFWTNKAIRYLVEHTANCEHPESFMDWIREFKKASKCDKAEGSLRSAIMRRLERVEELPALDLKQKAQLLFVLSLPVSMVFLERLKEAKCFVEVDDHRRITLFSSQDNTLRMGDHNPKHKFFKGEFLGPIKPFAKSATTPKSKKPSVSTPPKKATPASNVPSTSSTPVRRSARYAAPPSSTDVSNVVNSTSSPSSSSSAQKPKESTSSISLPSSSSTTALTAAGSSTNLDDTFEDRDDHHESEDDPYDADRPDEQVRLGTPGNRLNPSPLALIESTHLMESSAVSSPSVPEEPHRETKCPYRLPHHTTEPVKSYYNTDELPTSSGTSDVSNMLFSSNNDPYASSSPSDLLRTVKMEARKRAAEVNTPRSSSEGVKRMRKEGEELDVVVKKARAPATAKEFLLHLQRFVEIMNTPILRSVKAKVEHLLSNEGNKEFHLRNTVHVLRAFVITATQAPCPTHNEESVHLVRFLELLQYSVLVLHPEAMNDSNELLKEEIKQAGDRRISLERIAQALDQILLAAFPVTS